MCNKYCVFLLLLWAVPFFLQARRCLWRLASESGTDASVIAHIQPNGSGFQAIPFLSDVAAPPEGVQLLKASNGRCCGMTQQDGSSGVGVLFEYGPAGSGSYVKKKIDLTIPTQISTCSPCSTTAALTVKTTPAPSTTGAATSSALKTVP